MLRLTCPGVSRLAPLVDQLPPNSSAVRPPFWRAALQQSVAKSDMSRKSLGCRQRSENCVISLFAFSGSGSVTGKASSEIELIASSSWSSRLPAVWSEQTQRTSKGTLACAVHSF